MGAVGEPSRAVEAALRGQDGGLCVPGADGRPTSGDGHRDDVFSDQGCHGCARPLAKGPDEALLVGCAASANVVDDVRLEGGQSGPAAFRVVVGKGQESLRTGAASGWEHLGGGFEQRADVVPAYPPGEAKLGLVQEGSGVLDVDDVAGLRDLWTLLQGEDDALDGAGAEGDTDEVARPDGEGAWDGVAEGAVAACGGVDGDFGESGHGLISAARPSWASDPFSLRAGPKSPIPYKVLDKVLARSPPLRTAPAGHPARFHPKGGG